MSNSIGKTAIIVFSSLINITGDYISIKIGYNEIEIIVYVGL